MLCTFRRASVVLGLMMLPAVNSGASSFIYQFEPISVASVPSAPSPQITATLQDVQPGSVLLTIAASNFAPDQYLSDLYFSFDPADNVHQLYFQPTDGLRGLTAPRISTGVDSFVANDGYYDVHFNFKRMSKATFAADGSISYLIVGPGLNSADFLFAESTGRFADTWGAYYGLAHIQGTYGDSEWMVTTTALQPVPEPAAFAFLVPAIIGLWWAVRRQAKRTRRFAPACVEQAPRLSPSSKVSFAQQGWLH